MKTGDLKLEDWIFGPGKGWVGGWRVAGLLWGHLLLLLVSGGIGFAEDKHPDKCEVCQEKLYFESYVGKDPIRNVKRFFCESCYEAERCWACGLPVHEKTLRRLDDTRVLCHWDSQGIVVSQEEGEKLFRKHLKDWQRVLSPWPPFPDGNLYVHMVNQADFLRAYRRRPHLDDPELIRGLTMATSNAREETEFHIYILTGLLKNQFLAVAAHEYVHTWFYEHEDRKRQLHADTEEGFCEWLAWKHMVQLGDQIEQDRVLRNRYTRGQVRALIEAEQRYRVYDVVQWILYGVDSWLEEGNPRRLLALREKTVEAQSPLASFTPGERVVTPVPETLTLKGIAGAGKRRFVLINNATLAEGEKGKVRVGETTVMVKCVEIRADSALIEIGDEKKQQELKLSSGAGVE